MNSIFLDYAKYYDLLYKDKDYSSEANFIVNLIKKYAPDAKSILNLGCGTGKHDRFIAQAGYNITGIDLSEEMIAIANSTEAPGCTFFCGDARNFEFNEKFDVVISLFHVFSYQNSNEDVAHFLKTIARLSKKKSIAIFDYWYGPAVLNIKPENRTKRFESHSFDITRKATTSMDYVKNIATVKYQIEIKNNETNQITNLLENHPMRYFFSPEIELFLKNEGLKHLTHKAWPSIETEPNENTWAAYSIIKSFD